MRREYISFICSTPRRNAPPKHPALAFIKTTTSRCRNSGTFPSRGCHKHLSVIKAGQHMHTRYGVDHGIGRWSYLWCSHVNGCLWNCVLKLESEAKISATAQWMAVKWDVCSTVRQSADRSANIFAQTQGCSNIWTQHQHCHFWPRTVSAEHFRARVKYSSWESRLSSLRFET